jgi:hypothetical protein
VSSQQRTTPSQKLPKLTWLLTLFLFYHLSVVLITPNRENYFGYRYFRFLEPYVNFFEFSSQWTFFSPDPAPPIYIDWSIYDQAGKELKAGSFPDQKSLFVVGDRQVRRISATRFMIMGDGAAQKTLVPYLCGQNPGAYSVRLTRVLQNPPRMVEIIDGKKEAGDTSAYERSDLGLEFCENGKSKKSF